MALKRRKATETPEREPMESTIEYTNLEEGEHEGRLVYVADLGLQSKEYAGTFLGNIQQISLGIEIPDAHLVDSEGDKLPRLLWTKPFYIYNSLTKKGIELEYYSIFDKSAEPGNVPDWEAQLGKPVSAYVEHVNGKGENSDRVYDNIKYLSAIPAKYQDGVAKNELVTCIGDSDDPENECTKALFGLAKFVYEKRVQGNSNAVNLTPDDSVDDDDIAF